MRSVLVLQHVWRTRHAYHRIPIEKKLEQGKTDGAESSAPSQRHWEIRVRLQLTGETRDEALFDLAIDSKLRACDLTKLRVNDISHGQRVAPRVIVMQQKTKRPVQFEIMEQTRKTRILDTDRASARRRLLVSQSYSKFRAPFYAAIRSYRKGMGCFDRSRSRFVRYSYAAPNQSDVDLQKNQESEGCAVAPRTYQVGKHGTLPGY